MNEFGVTAEFIEQNKHNLSQFRPKSRRRGPYSKRDKETRRFEVHRLCFDYGFSARIIAKMMKVNRNTVNADLNYLYSEIVETNNTIDPGILIAAMLERLDIQYSRLRKQYDETDSQQERNALERLMLEVNSRIITTNQKLAESKIKVKDLVTRSLNEHLEEDRSKTRYMTLFDRIRVSVTAHEQISKIIQEDQKKGDYY